MRTTIISLFDYTGNWSKPYKDAGFKVVQIDLKHGIDFMQWDYKSIPQGSVYGVLAAVPCTYFTKCGALYWPKWDANGETKKAVDLANRTLDCIDYHQPLFWSIENPPGRLPSLVPRLAKYRLLSFHPCDYGDGYKKQTELFGYFNPMLVKKPVRPINTTNGNLSIDEYYNLSSLTYKQRAAYRDITPPGFANSFFLANSIWPTT